MAPPATVPTQGTRGPSRPRPHLALPSPTFPGLVDAGETWASLITGEFAHLVLFRLCCEWPAYTHGSASTMATT